MIPSAMESLIRTGSLQSRISLQYLQAYGIDGKDLYSNYVDEINSIPGTATNSVDWLAPNWYRMNLNPLQTVPSAGLGRKPMSSMRRSPSTQLMVAD